MLKNFFISSLLLLQSVVFSKIIECNHFLEIYSHIDQKTLIVLDIDDTLLVPEQMLGSDEWFCHRIKAYQAVNYSKNEALEKALAEWEGIRHLSKMKLVEPSTDEIIKDLQAKGYKVMGLTTQGLGLATRTYLQLQSNNIDLTKTAPCSQDCFFLEGDHGILFRHGILFTSGTSKELCFEKLCEVLSFSPEKILFVNDKKTHLADLEKFAEKKGIPFIGLRYGYSDFRKKAFNPFVADYQFEHSSCSHLMSDEEALLNMTP